ncbi:MAG: Arc family DNA-binding protein [Rhizobiaceae bacterium]|nr:Arc family DNA-binding protein [Rhizobiaceae bacterium]
MNKKPGRGSDQFPLRFPDGMRDRIKASAEVSGRSMNAEIVAKLERYDSLVGQVAALESVARALAAEIDSAVGEDPDFLFDRVSEVFAIVDQFGNVDRDQLYREWSSDAARRLKGAMRGTFHVRDELLDRIKAKAQKAGRSVDAEILNVLEREYPAPADVMHIHIDNIRHALDLYERETDPQARMRLQTLVEMMATSGHNLELDWDEDGEL